MLTLSLSSSPKGNAIRVEAPGVRWLFDSGMGATQLGGRLRLRGCGTCEVGAV